MRAWRLLAFFCAILLLTACGGIDLSILNTVTPTPTETPTPIPNSGAAY